MKHVSGNVQLLRHIEEQIFIFPLKYQLNEFEKMDFSFLVRDMKEYVKTHFSSLPPEGEEFREVATAQKNKLTKFHVY